MPNRFIVKGWRKTRTHLRTTTFQMFDVETFCNYKCFKRDGPCKKNKNKAGIVWDWNHIDKIHHFKLNGRYNDLFSKIHLPLGKMLTDVSHTLFYVNINESSNCLHIFPITTKSRCGCGFGCERSEENAHSTMAHDLTSNFCKGSCLLCSFLYFLFGFLN